jgi:hypothetical protein
LQNVLDNFKRQDFSNKKLVIIENGNAVGTCKKHGVEPDLLLTSGNHQATAKNAGIEAIRERGGGFWATYDDDDYYGPHYLSEMVGYSDKAEIIGKGDFFVRMAGGTLRFFGGIACEEYTRFVHGPTICSWTELPCEFPNTGDIGEDCALVKNMVEEGGRIWAASKHHFIFHRYPSADHHTWKISDNTLTESLMCGMYETMVRDYGPNIAYDFVNGIGEEPEYEEIERGFNDEEKLAKLDETGKTKEFITKVLCDLGMIKEGEDPYKKLKRTDCTLMMQNTFRDGERLLLLDKGNAIPIEEGPPHCEEEY